MLPSKISPKIFSSPESTEKCDVPSLIYSANKLINESDSTISVFQRSSTNPSTIKVYLRLKPTPTTVTDQNQDSYVILNPTTLLTKCPSFDSKRKTVKFPKTESIARKFTFAKIFNSETSQADLFDHSVRHHVIDFLSGKNSTIMTYGTSNSGKTYTLHGTPSSPGIIPRTIELIFSSINCTLAPWYKATQANTISFLNESERLEEIQKKTSLINPSVIDEDRITEARRSLENSSSPTVKTDEENYEEAMTSVWLSFAEIYNENIYDLIQFDDYERRPLKLVTDKEGATYVKDLKAIHVTTGLEACQLLITAQSRMTVARTMLNPKRSRSHTISIFKLLKYQKPETPDEVQLSTLTFCDLAGSGRSRTGQETGIRLKESRSINNSLLVLGRCLKTVSDNHSMKRSTDQVIGPFRESKLTRVFQKALSGKEELSFVVNVDPTPEIFTENQGVLNFTAIVRKIIIESKDSKRSFLSGVNPGSPTMSSTWEVVSLPSLGETPEEGSSFELDECRTLKERNKKLSDELEALKSIILNYEKKAVENVHRKCQSSNTMPCRVIDENHFIDPEDYKNLEKENRILAEKLAFQNDRLNEFRSCEIGIEPSVIDLKMWEKNKEIEDEGEEWSVENFEKERIDYVTRRRKRKRVDRGDFEENRWNYEDLEMLEKLRNENEVISAEKNKCSFELALTKKELKDFQKCAKTCFPELLLNDEADECNSTSLVDKLQRMIDDKTRRSERLEKDLDEVRNEYVRIDSSSSKREEELAEVKAELESSLLKIKDLEDEVFKKENCINSLQYQLQISESRVAKIDGSNFNEVKFISEKKISSPIRKYSTISNDFFCNDEIDDATLETQAHVDIKAERNYNLDGKNSTKKLLLNNSDGDCKCYFENSGCTFRSSEGSIKEDSGFASSSRSRRSTSISDSTKIYETDEKSTQTCSSDEESMQEKFERLKTDYANVQTQHLQETLRVAELSQELQYTKATVKFLKEHVETNEPKMIECRNTITRLKEEFGRLIEKNNEREIRCEELKNLMETLTEEITSVTHSSELRGSFIEQCTNFERRIFLLQSYVETLYTKCHSKHVPKIERLEQELSTKTMQLNELNDKFAERELDALRVQELNEKVNDFESRLEKCQKERNDYRRRLQERVEEQSTLEIKLKQLSGTIEERENELMTLKTEIGNITHTSVTNDEKAKDLTKQIVRYKQAIFAINEELARSEELRRKVEETSKQEISRLELRLGAFEKNTILLNQAQEREEENEEVDRLKQQLSEKEEEMMAFKKHRDVTIQNYEYLVKQLQIELEKRKEEVQKLEKLFLPATKTSPELFIERDKFKVSEGIRKFPQTQELVKNKACNWKPSRNGVEAVDEESTSLIPTFAVSQHSSGEILHADCTNSSEDKDLDISDTYEDEESCQTESSPRLNETDCQVDSDSSEEIEIRCSCGIGFRDSRKQRMAGWMKVRRIDAKTELLRCREETFGLSDCESEG